MWASCQHPQLQDSLALSVPTQEPFLGVSLSLRTQHLTHRVGADSETASLCAKDSKLLWLQAVGMHSVL